MIRGGDRTLDKPSVLKKNRNAEGDAGVDIEWVHTRGVEILRKNSNRRLPERYGIYFDGLLTREIPPDEDSSRVDDGKRSEHEARLVLIRVIQPACRTSILKREVSMLKRLRKCPQVLKLLLCVKGPTTKVRSLVFSHPGPFRALSSVIPSLTTSAIRFYSKQLLDAISYIHAKEIMHRNINHNTVWINSSKKSLVLAGWRLAEIVHEDREYNVRLSKRGGGTAPELLLGVRKYGKAVDMWGFGSLLAGMFAKRTPFFTGADNTDQIVQIAKVLGTESLQMYHSRAKISMDISVVMSVLSSQFGREGPVFSGEITPKNQPQSSAEIEPRNIIGFKSEREKEKDIRRTIERKERNGHYANKLFEFVSDFLNPSKMSQLGLCKVHNKGSPKLRSSSFEIEDSERPPFDGLEVVRKCLQWDPHLRFTVERIQQSPFFDFETQPAVIQKLKIPPDRGES
eukprot:CAMPEP_0114488950 /NCGR_PEP_ID=MMETSP0109-20121206/1616_1 /TAXON_ID=29199 /ORGANISM="Chlorarachnion reptans, Strain CCCM449" /LENGTH=454 /DNA_ID=CAMNT_0001665403 /DNA_START=61 /DNA_END=1425 /DNA_ORIENTATION=+